MVASYPLRDERCASVADSFESYRDLALLESYALTAMSCRSDMIRFVKSFCCQTLDADLVVDEAISKGWEILAAEASGRLDPHSFRLMPNMDLQSFIRFLVGRPYAGRRGGIVATHVRRVHVRMSREISLEKLLEADSGAVDRIDDMLLTPSDWVSDTIDVLDDALAQLKPRERFIVEARFGIPITEEFNAASIQQKARRAGFSLREAGRMGARAKRTAVGENRSRLEIQELALLLDLSTRQVGRLFATAIGALRQFLAEYLNSEEKTAAA